MARHQMTNWNLPGKCETWEQVQVALLMDIRELLTQIASDQAAVRQRLHCHEVTEGFRSIRKNYLYTRRRWPLPVKKSPLKNRSPK